MKECDRVRIYSHPEGREKPVREYIGEGNLVMMAPFKGDSPLKAAPDLHERDGHEETGEGSHPIRRVATEGPLVRWIVVLDSGVVAAHWVAAQDVIFPKPIEEIPPTFTAGPDTTGIDVKAIHGVINGPAATDRPPEIQALYLLFEAAKLWQGIGQQKPFVQALSLAQMISEETTGADQWIEETNDWIIDTATDYVMAKQARGEYEPG